jgi:thioredoxin 1
MKNLVELTEDNFESEVSPVGPPLVADFYAPWCGPCRVLAPLLEQIAGGFTGRLKFARVNVDENPGLAARYNITGVPTLILFRGGQPADQVVGFPGPRELKAWLDRSANPAVTA